MKILLFFLGCSCLSLNLIAQSFYRNTPRTIPGNGQVLTDTLPVSALNAASLNAGFGLDSISLRINYSNDEDLLISLIAPDGTVLQLANNLGGGNNNYTNTRFTMSVDELVGLSSAPFSGAMRPESWMGRANNGQSGNGNWVLRIYNSTSGSTTGTLVKWGLHFDNSPAPPEFFAQSTLPIVVINTHNIVAQHNIKNEVNGTMGIIDNASQVNVLGNTFNGYNGNASIKVRGNTSADFPQKSYTLTTTDASGDDNEVPLLGMSTGSKWVLYGAWDDKTLIRNIITYQLSNEMGAYAPRTRLCELVIDGDYKGVYALMEKIKRDDNRVAVDKLSTSTVSGDALTGGYIFQVDRGESPGNDSWLSNYPPCAGSNGDISFVYEYPADDKINTAQKTYIAGYVDSFEAALMSGNLYDTVNGYRRYIDVASFTDQSILQELGHNVDGYRLSSFLHKGKNKKLRAGPIWDFNLAYGNADYYNGAATDNFEWDLPCPANDGNLNPFWWKKFETDTLYMKDYKCRYTTLRQTVLDTLHLDHIVDSLKAKLSVPKDRHYMRWPVMGVYLWPNAYVGNTWDEEYNYLKTWLHQRVRWMDTQLYDTACLPSTPPVSINEAAPETWLNIFPNPAGAVLYIQSKGVTIDAVALYNVTGQLVWSARVNAQQKRIDLKNTGLSKGIYTIWVTAGKGQVRKKIVLL